jgi:hypothetical protein
LWILYSGEKKNGYFSTQCGKGQSLSIGFLEADFLLRIDA